MKTHEEEWKLSAAWVGFSLHSIPEPSTFFFSSLRRAVNLRWQMLGLFKDAVLLRSLIRAPSSAVAALKRLSASHRKSSVWSALNDVTYSASLSSQSDHKPQLPFRFTWGAASPSHMFPRLDVHRNTYVAGGAHSWRHASSLCVWWESTSWWFSRDSPHSPTIS